MKDIEVIFHHFENDDEKKQMNYVYRLIEKGIKSNSEIFMFMHRLRNKQNL